jgi:hypothetical protein
MDPRFQFVFDGFGVTRQGSGRRNFAAALAASCQNPDMKWVARRAIA